MENWKSIIKNTAKEFFEPLYIKEFWYGIFVFYAIVIIAASYAE